MKAAVFEGLERMTVRQVPDPSLPDEASLILKVHACAVCGSDIRIFHHGNPRVTPPQIIGHEVAGEVVEVGKEVTRFKVGDRLATGADVPCGECEWCREGLPNNCAINYAIGYQFPGGLAEYMMLNARTLRFGAVHPIPLALSYDQATLAEPLGCCINGLELAQIKLGDTVVVIGAGPAGCMLMRLARSFGAIRVIGVQRSRARVSAAYTLGGADVVLCSEEVDPVQGVWEATGGRGADVVITANSSPETHQQALRMVRNRGRINLFGGLPQDAPPIALESNLIHYKELLLTGSHGSVPRHHRLALDLLACGVIEPDGYISHTFALDEVLAAFAAAESHEGMKVIVHPHGS
ncbi:MAG: alcohol dehydrogenase catalytic domain-containing protein [Chloroflexi bacterium]|nr:alcohol dehydrogenase catalytic domain-containing protein [Chloroflexota bacterium]